MNERLVETSWALEYYSIACIANIQFTKEELYQIVLLLIIYENIPTSPAE